MRRKGNSTGMRTLRLLAAIFSGLIILTGSSFAQADFLSFNFTLNPSYTESINTTTRVIEVEVYNSADVTNLVAVFTVSPNASVRIGSVVQVSGQTANSFENQVTYLVTSADGTVTKEWYVKVSKRAVAVEKQLLSFQFASIGAVATINETDHTVYITVPHSQNVTSLVATFQLSPLATARMNGVVQISGITANDYTAALEENGNTITFTVVAENQSSRNYYISVRRAAPLSGKEISYFAFESLDPDVIGVIDQINSTITCTVPFQTDVSNLKAKFTSSYLSVVKVGTVIQVSGTTANNFTSPIDYTVVAEDGSSRVYRVTVNKAPASSLKQITAFRFSNINPEVTGTINEADHTIVATIPYASDITGLIATFTTSQFAQVTINSVLQVSGTTANNFTNPVIYTVTAQDGSTQNYTVTVTQQAASQENDFLSYKLEATRNSAISVDAVGTINTGNKTVVIQVPYGTNVTALIPTFTHSALSSVSINGVEQISGVTPVNFTSPASYTITAQDGSVEIYTVTVNQIPASQENTLISFKFESSLNGSISSDKVATIDQVNKTATIHVPFTANVTNLIATFVISEFAHAKIGAVNQVSGVTANDFTNNLVYSIVAQDGSTELYTVSVIRDPNTEKRFLSFSFQALSPPVYGTIDEAAKTIKVEVPNSTIKTSLVASFTLSQNAEAYIANTKQVSGTTANNFTSPQVYTVHAQDGSTQDYVVTVTNLPLQTSKLITDFRFAALNPEVVATIDQTNKTIKAEVPYGTGLSNLVATFTHSYLSTVSVGSVVQVSGTTPNNFTAPVSYKVTAEDQSNQTYTVTVTQTAPSSEKRFLYFAFESFDPIIVGTIDQAAKTIKLVVPNGTDRTQLVASFTVSEFADVRILNGGYQQSGLTSNDYSEPVVYQVVAQDGSSEEYIITVTEEPDVTAPVVTAAAQSVSNELSQFVLVSSNEATGKVYIVHETVPQSTVAELNASIPLAKGASGVVQAADQNTPISTFALVEGTYYAYAVDGAGNMSAKGTNPIVVVDELAPTVYINTQTVTNAPNKFIPAQSSESKSYIYLIKEGVAQSTKADMELAVSSRNGAKVYAPVAFTNASLLVSGLSAGEYHAYAIDQNGNISTQSTQVVTIVQASRLKSITSFSFQSTNPASVGEISGSEISVQVPNGTNLQSLVATFSLSTGARAFIGLIQQVSGVTSNDYSTPLIYTVEAEDGSTLNYTVTVTVNSGTGIEEIDWNLSIVSYPNPVKDLLTIDMSQSIDRIQICDLLGHIVTDIEVHSGNRQSIAAESWTPGIYVIRFYQNGSAVHYTKVIKQ